MAAQAAAPGNPARRAQKAKESGIATCGGAGIALASPRLSGAEEESMKNKLTDLNNHLFAQLERLSDEAISKEDLDKEIRRTDAIITVSTQIVDTANVAIKAASLVAEYGGNYAAMLPGVEGKTTVEQVKDHPKLAAPKEKKP
jgi:hypothetical protein